MLDTIRRWMGATRRERELRALADGLQAECDRWMRKIAANAKVHDAAIAELREQLETVIAARNDAQSNAGRLFRELGLKDICLAAAVDERDGLAGRLKAAEAERDAAIAERDEARRLLKAAGSERDETQRQLLLAIGHRDVHAATIGAIRAKLKRVASDLRAAAFDVTTAAIEIDSDLGPDESPDDRPATDSGAEGAGTTPE